MEKMIKDLTSKLAKLEVDHGTQNIPTQEMPNRNPNQFDHPFNPQYMQRDRRENEYQKIQPPLQNNLVNEIDKFDQSENEEID